MATTELEPVNEPSPLVTAMKGWLKQVGPFWAASIAGHLIALIVLALVLGTVHVAKKIMDAPEFEAEVETALPEPDLTRFEVSDTPIEPTVLDTESLTLEPPKVEQTEQYNDDSATFVEAGGGMAMASATNLGGLGGFDFKAIGEGAAVTGKGGVGTSAGTSNTGGSGGAGSGFGGRGSGHRKEMVGGFGGTKQSERAVAAALNWIARHQGPQGNWSLDQYTAMCKDSTCTGPGAIKSSEAGTAFALLPFFAAGQTHMSKGPYQKTIHGGLLWLVKNQQPNGSLAGPRPNMYIHGLCAICLCEAYGLTKDKTIGVAAQAGINFIQSAQNTEDGGWRYTPGEVPGDTSAVGWQIMALKSGLMAGLTVSPEALDGSKKFLKLASAKSKNGGLFGYLPGGGGTPTMTAVGLLCSQYMGLKRSEPASIEGMTYLMRNLPTVNQRNCYYWYYATQVMHNLPGPEWDAWNRQMRRILIETQVKEGCAAGSWDPEKPTKDAWGAQGGRIMCTSIGCLTLEVYYRYLPLYQLDKTEEAGGQMAAAGKAKEAAPAK
jgi:hypothetical protein